MTKSKEEKVGEDKININFGNDIVTLYYDGSEGKAATLDKLYQEKETLINSIERRKKLLSNENYINKAPQNIVENERLALEKEENALKSILEKII